MTKIKPLKWLPANDTLYAAPINSKCIYYIKQMDDGTFELDQLDMASRQGTRTFHPTMEEAKSCANRQYMSYLSEKKS